MMPGRVEWVALVATTLVVALFGNQVQVDMLVALVVVEMATVDHRAAMETMAPAIMAVAMVEVAAMVVRVAGATKVVAMVSSLVSVYSLY